MMRPYAICQGCGCDCICAVVEDDVGTCPTCKCFHGTEPNEGGLIG
jgi:hypothetical protein